MSEVNETKKPGLASISGYFEKLREEGLEEERRNEGFVWTIQAGGTTSLSMAGLIKVDYTLDLNCSHVGPTAYGIYRGEMSFRFKGEIGGVKTMLAILGFRSSEDVEGWFRNDRFVMKLSEYCREDEDEFLSYYVNGGNNVISAGDSAAGRPQTGDPAKDAAARAGEELANSLVNALLGSIKSSGDARADAGASSLAPTGIWHDWDYRMTEGDMGTYMKISGGRLFWSGHGQSGMSSGGHSVKGSATADTVFSAPATSTIDDDVLFPFPYVLKVYPNGLVRVTLYNYNGGPVTVEWSGSIDRVPVSETVITGRQS